MDDAQKLRVFYNELLSFQGKSLDQSTAYNQVVVLAGYAAFFAVWSAVGDELPSWVVLTCGALITISVTVYVGWTVANMIFLSGYQRESTVALSEGFEGFEARVDAVNLKWLNKRASLMKWWLPVVGTASASALVASVVLSIAALGQTLHFSLGCS